MYVERKAALACWIAINMCSWISANECVAEGKHDYLKISQANMIQETELGASLTNAFKDHEILVISFTELSEGGANIICVRVIGEKPEKSWWCMVYCKDYWESMIQLLGDRAGYLTSHHASDEKAPGGGQRKVITLTYELPRPKTIEVGGITCVLSQKVQQYFKFFDESSYPASVRLLNIADPHHKRKEQYNLLKGLEIFFEDNPQLLNTGRVVFLTEGYQAGRVLSLKPLIEADPRPKDPLIRSILGTYLINGYVAYEWKNQKGISLVGMEDMRLYEINVRLQVARAGSGDRDLSHLNKLAIAGRNKAMAETILSLINNKIPISFLTGDHMHPKYADVEWSERYSKGYPNVLNARHVELLKGAGKKGVVDFLKEARVGYYYLEAKDDPYSTSRARKEEIKAYGDAYRLRLKSMVH